MAKQTVKEAVLDVQSVPSTEMVAALTSFYQANKIKNKAASDEKNSRTLLYKLMVARPMTVFTKIIEHAGKKINLKAWVGQKWEKYIDPSALVSHLTTEEFMSVVSISKTDLKKAFPERFDRLVALSERERICPENVHIEVVE